MEKVIVTVAVTGALTTRDQQPNLPHTPEETARSAVESWKAGAAIAHLHVRDPLTGQGRQDVELFKKTIGLIRKECDIVINVTTGGAPGLSNDQRIAIIPALASDKNLKPEICSLNAGSINFGIFSKKKRAFMLDVIQLNPWGHLLKFADTMKTHGVKPEIEIYEAGMINNAKFLQGVDALVPPLHFQFVLGVLGGLQPTVDNLVFLKNSIPPGSTWSLCAVGLDIFSLGAVAIAAGGHVRVGFEDNVYISKGTVAKSNAQLVSKLVQLAKAMDREIATPGNARKILGL